MDSSYTRSNEVFSYSPFYGNWTQDPALSYDACFNNYVKYNTDNGTWILKSNIFLKCEKIISRPCLLLIACGWPPRKSRMSDDFGARNRSTVEVKPNRTVT